MWVGRDKAKIYHKRMKKAQEREGGGKQEEEDSYSGMMVWREKGNVVVKMTTTKDEIFAIRDAFTVY